MSKLQGAVYDRAYSFISNTGLILFDVGTEDSVSEFAKIRGGLISNYSPT